MPPSNATPSSLSAPENVAITVASNNQPTVTWDPIENAKGYDVQVVNSAVLDPATNKPIVYELDTVSDPSAKSYTFPDTSKWPADWQSSEYQGQVRARSVAAGNDPAPGPWAGSFLWHVEPGLTITIGSATITLTRVPSLSGDQRFQLVNLGSPVTVTVQELADYISNLGKLGLPSLPHLNFGADQILAINAFSISASGYFNLNLTLQLGDPGYTLFPGLTLNSVSINVLHTNDV